MKKIIAIVLVVVVAAVAVFALTGNKTPDASNDTAAYADATEVLTTIFASYAEENKFPVAGGDEANMSFEGPAKYDYTLADELGVVAKLPASQAANIEDAATAMHAMNANSFTGAAYKLVDGADAVAFAEDFKTELDTARWMCGFPEKFVVVKTGGYLVTAYGVADIMDYFKTTVSAIEGVEVVLEGDIAG